MWLIPLLHGYVSTHLFRCHALYVNCPPTLGLQCLFVCIECVFRYLIYFLYHGPLPPPHVISYQPGLSLALLLYSVPVCGFLRYQLRLFIGPSTPFRPFYPEFFKTISQPYVDYISVTSTAFELLDFQIFLLLLLSLVKIS